MPQGERMTMDDMELLELMWTERDGELPDVGEEFARYIGEEFTPWDVLELCNPPNGLSAPTMRDFFDDWVVDRLQYRPDIITEITGWTWDEEEKVWTKEVNE